MIRRVIAWLWAFAILVAVGLTPRAASAHALDRGYLVVTETSPGEALVSMRASGVRDLTAPDGCALTPTSFGTRSQSVQLARLTCKSGFDGVELTVSGLAPGQVIVARVEHAGGQTDGVVLSAASPRLRLTHASSLSTTFRRYVRLGAEHVSTGADHLLFLLALTWQALSRAKGEARPAAKRLLGLATAFTFAHSLTLTATVLGALRVRPELAEALIALSLVLVALDDEGSGTSPWLVFAFGLVHGLGFANGLSEAGLPERATVPALVAFNVGVELAQAGLLTVMLGALLLASKAAGHRTVTATVTRYAVGCAGAYLFSSRAALVLVR